MKKILLLTTASAFDNGWKFDDDGNIVLKDGNPVYLNTSGEEMVVEHNTISRLNAEAKSHREAKQALEKKLKLYENIDPDKAREALDKMSKVEANKLIEAGKVDDLKRQITEQFQTQLQEKENALKSLEEKYNEMHINNVFANSEFIRNNLAVPRDMFEATFRNNFKVEDGQVVVYDKSGNRLLSKTRSGEYADPEEALQLLVEAHPQKDVILKADVGNGSGNTGGAGGTGKGRVMKRAEFSQLPPNQQAEIAKKVSNGEMRLTD